MRRALVVSVVILTAVLGLAACSSDDSKDGSSSTSSSSKAAAAAPVQLSGQVNNKGTKDISTKGASTELELETDDFYFKPTFTKVAAGQKVKVEIENEGSATHTFTDPALNIDQEIEPGSKATVNVTIPASGTVEFYCRFHRSSGMQGAFFTG